MREIFRAKLGEAGNWNGDGNLRVVSVTGDPELDDYLGRKPTFVALKSFFFHDKNRFHFSMM